MFEYAIIFIGLILAIFMWVVYKKIDQKNNNHQEIKNEVLSEKLEKKLIN